MNPTHEIYFMFVTRSNHVSMKYSDLVDALLSYPNVNFRFLNPIEYARHTPLEDFFVRDELSKSKYIIEHTSDILRILTLYKFGGLYLDLDVTCLRSMKDIATDELIKMPNFVSLETYDHIENAIMKFGYYSLLCVKK